MTTATELMRRALGFWDNPESDRFGTEAAKVFDEIRAFLAAEEQYDALRERYVEGLGNSMKDCKESFEREAERVKELLAAEPEAECSDHPDAPHGFDRNASHNSGRYVCTCEGWEPEAEPVGYAVKMVPRGLHFIGFVGEEETDEEIEEYGPDQIVPLYTKPEPARKPMTEEELENVFRECHGNFEKVVRAIEKHHGIDGNPSEIINNQEVDKPEKDT